MTGAPSKWVAPPPPRKEASAPGGDGGQGAWSVPVKGRKWRPLLPLTWILGGEERLGAHQMAVHTTHGLTHTRPFPPPASLHLASPQP